MKILNIATILFMAVPVFASEITSPFYTPEVGHVLNKVSAVYSKNKLKKNKTSSIYQRNLIEELMLGVGAGFSFLLGGEYDWAKYKHDETRSFPAKKGYRVGMQGQWDIENFLVQISGQYKQTTNINFSPRRAIETHIRLGQKLQKMTPYLHFENTLPLNADPEFNDPIYRLETGVFQKVNDKLTLDTALYFSYNKNIKERSCGIHGELSYSLNNWTAIGINGGWQARGRAKNKTHTYHQSIGINWRLAF